MDEDDPLAPPTLGGRGSAGPRQTLGGAATGNEARLIPLARAQDAVARLGASVGAAPDDVAAGLRARLALFEAAGFLWRIAAPPCIRTIWRCVTPISLAPTRSRRSPAGCGKRRPGARRWAGEGVAGDQLVAQALAYARHWRRLAELASVRPLA